MNVYLPPKISLISLSDSLVSLVYLEQINTVN